MRKLSVMVAFAMMSIVGTGASPVAAATVGPTGAIYESHLTCATNGFTSRVDLRGAHSFTSALMTTFSNGSWGGGTAFDLGTAMPVSFPDVRAAWSMETLDPFAIFQTFEMSTDGDATPVGEYGDLGECPDYAASVGSAFTSVTPRRILDTRGTSPLGLGVKPADRGIVDVVVAGVAGVPADATAVAVNVTATDTTAAGYVQALPTGLSQVGGFSTLNVTGSAQTVANFAIVPLGVDGKLSIFTERSAHLIVDLAGYFTETLDPVTAGRFVQISPNRVLDTRPSTAASTTTKPAAGEVVTVSLAGVGGLPVSNLSAVVVNITITEASAGGFVQAAPSGGLVVGSSSNLNIEHAGQTKPNLAIVPLGADGNISVYLQGGGHVIVDVLGAFTGAGATSSTSGLFVPVEPERFLDSRPLSAIGVRTATGSRFGDEKLGPINDTRAHFFGLDRNNVGAVVLNLTATDPNGAGFVQAGPIVNNALANRGGTSNVNVEGPNQTVANAAIIAAGETDGLVFYASTNLQLIGDISGFFRK